MARVSANRREESLTDDPAMYNRLLCGCLNRLPGIRRAAVACNTIISFKGLLSGLSVSRSSSLTRKRFTSALRSVSIEKI